MRIAFKTALHHTTWREVLEVWHAADDLEVFESGWVFDHFYPIRGDTTGPCLEAWTALAALGQATERLRLGVMVTGNVYRHPAVLANMAATVDLVTGGRLELGIGAGWNEEECTAYGIDLPPLKERFDAFDEACEVLVRLLSDPVTDLAGRYYRLSSARCEPKPVQRPHPPLCIGGSGERRTLRTVARHAQHWNFPVGPVEDFLRKREVLAGHCAEIGRDVDQIATSTHLWLDDGGDLEALRRSAEDYAGAGLDLAIVYLPEPHRVETLHDVARTLEDLAD